MKLGLWGARADRRGLCYQMQSYAKWLQPHRVFGIDMTADELSPYQCDWSAYDQSTLDVMRHSDVTEGIARRWLRDLDVVLAAETFYRDPFPEWARAEGVRTVLHANPEFVGYWHTGQHDPRPDVLLAPTTWRLGAMPGALHLPFPVDRQLFPFRLRTAANRFVHIAGHRAMADRAGTRIVLGAAMRLANVDIVVRTQSPPEFEAPRTRRVTMQHRNFDTPQELYADVDIAILPRRYGGNYLVAQEALSSGIPIITLDREPENTWGGVVTIPAKPRRRIRTKAGPIEVWDGSPRELLRVVNELRKDPDRVKQLSFAANSYAATISWDHLLPVYHDVLETIANGDDPADLLRRLAPTLHGLASPTVEGAS